MEILEILNYNVDFKSNILDVSFRLIDDADDTQRTDRIDYSQVEEYGYDLVSQDFDLFDDIDDEDELIAFLNEYYLVNPSSLPKASFF